MVKIAYSVIIGDLFHYGHLSMLELAKKSADIHICGVLSDDIVSSWISPHICNFQERSSVIKGLKCVDFTIEQNSLDPTENLKLIQEKYQDSKIILIQNHHFGDNIYGLEYLKQVKGEVLYHEFYNKLSRDKISKKFINASFLGSNALVSSTKEIKRIPIFTSKADTLRILKQQLTHSRIENEFVFTVNDWKNNPEKIVNSIKTEFTLSKVVVRSSSKNEDSLNESNAGYFKSILNVHTTDDLMLSNAINEVIESYERSSVQFSDDQVLVQRQTDEIAISGVVFTRNLLINTPYYLINYDDKSGKSDTVTSGIVNNKLEIHKEAEIDKIPPIWQKLIVAVKEIENIYWGITLDIEFAIKKNDEVIIFQVRPLAANSKYESIDDIEVNARIKELSLEYEKLTHKNLNQEVPLSDMAFWNPAELIGDRPYFLDYSLFHHLITKENWNSALTKIGYTAVSESLLVLIGNKPYINVKNAIYGLLPSNLSVTIKDKLYKLYIKKLQLNPELHDKVEFELIHNCYRFDLNPEEFYELFDIDFVLSAVEINQIIKSLKELTISLFLSFTEIEKQDNQSIKILDLKFNEIKENYTAANSSVYQKIKIVQNLIEDCKLYGIEQFTRAARYAFISNTLLKSIVKTGNITESEYQLFLSTIKTVASDLDEAFNDLKEGRVDYEVFIQNYGHLRPGTYDITKMPYSKEPLYFTNEEILISQEKHISTKESTALINDKMVEILDKLSKEHDLKCKGLDLLNFIKSTIQYREYFKFIFTKNISFALEVMSDIGDQIGFERSEIAHLDYNSVISSLNLDSEIVIKNFWKNLIHGRKQDYRINSLISLSPLIFSQIDFYLVLTHIAKPNFITEKSIISKVICLDHIDKLSADLIDDKIVIIEKADPGFDWIFTKNIKGLITKYGGAASHMAIRSAEFELPAAIGCGDLLYAELKVANSILLDCKNKLIKKL